MLKKIRIHNFQALKEISLDLGKLTVIVGETDSGKSSFIRSLVALANNRAGDEFVSFGEKNARVEVELDTGAKVIWLKGKDNKFSIEAEGQVANFEKCGTDAPPEVKKLLKMSGIMAGQVEFNPNFHTQFDMPFLLTSSALQVSKIIGEITNVNLLFNATKEARSRIMSYRQTMSIRVKDLEEVRESVKDYANLEAHSKKIEDALAKITDYEQKELKVRTLSALGGRINEQKISLHDTQITVDNASKWLGKTEKMKDISEYVVRLQELQKLVGRMAVAHQEQGKAVIERNILLERDKRYSKVSEIKSKLDKLNELRSIFNRIDLEVKARDLARQYSFDMNINATTAAGELDGFKEANPICPLCGAATK